MSCCGGSCSCGKADQAPDEHIRLVQMSAREEKLSGFNWISGLKNLTIEEEVVEIRFKNMRKEFFRSSPGLELSLDDRVVVEIDKGYDLGTVSLAGSAAVRKFEQTSGSDDRSRLYRVDRKAGTVDLENWLNSKKRERYVLLEARKIALDISLDTRVNDVEFRGDGQKVTIFYSAGNSDDFQRLLRTYASEFSVKVEMRQVAAERP